MAGIYGEDTRVPFGAGESDTVPVAWAGAMLTWMRDNHPQVFISALAVAATGIEPAAKRGRREGGGRAAPMAPITTANGAHAKAG